MTKKQTLEINVDDGTLSLRDEPLKLDDYFLGVGGARDKSLELQYTFMDSDSLMKEAERIYHFIGGENQKDIDVNPCVDDANNRNERNYSIIALTGDFNYKVT